MFLIRTEVDENKTKSLATDCFSKISNAYPLRNLQLLLDNIADQEIETGVKMHLQYLNLVISGENLDIAHKRWEEMVRSTVVVGSTDTNRRIIDG